MKVHIFHVNPFYSLLRTEIIIIFFPLPASGSRFRRSADILSTLVNIYGSKELFVNEYRALLADRILMQYNYDVERELRYLELLKLRFGEAQLHFCEVMLRDVAESRRVNARIQEAGKTAPENSNQGSEQMVILHGYHLNFSYDCNGRMYYIFF